MVIAMAYFGTSFLGGPQIGNFIDEVPFPAKRHVTYVSFANGTRSKLKVNAFLDGQIVPRAL